MCVFCTAWVHAWVRSVAHSQRAQAKCRATRTPMVLSQLSSWSELGAACSSRSCSSSPRSPPSIASQSGPKDGWFSRVAARACRPDLQSHTAARLSGPCAMSGSSKSPLAVGPTCGGHCAVVYAGGLSYMFRGATARPGAGGAGGSRFLGKSEGDAGGEPCELPLGAGPGGEPGADPGPDGAPHKRHGPTLRVTCVKSRGRRDQQPGEKGANVRRRGRRGRRGRRAALTCCAAGAASSALDRRNRSKPGQGPSPRR